MDEVGERIAAMVAKGARGVKDNPTRIDKDKDG
jgi:hypothetical protein